MNQPMDLNIPSFSSIKRRPVARFSRSVAALGLTLLLALSLVVAAFAAAGDLDTSFNPSGSIPGSIRNNFDPQADRGMDVAIQNDGKIVQIINLDQAGDFAVARFNLDGSLDTTFGGGAGWVRTVTASSDEAFAGIFYRDASDQTGKIIAAGIGGGSLMMVRYLPDGSLDPTFGSGGIVLTNIPGSSREVIYDLEAQPDGKIVIVGYVRPQNNPPLHDLLVARYLPNGSLDPTFSGDGIYTQNIQTEERLEGVAILPDGRIAAAGFTDTDGSIGPTGDNADFLVIRLTPGGDPDLTFGGTGYAIFDPGVGQASALDAAVQRDGKILAGGSWWMGEDELDFALLRYNTDGTPDTTFGGDGLVTVDYSSYSDEIRALSVQADGKILGSGVMNFGQGREFGVVRYMAEDGSLDTSFGGDGKVVVDLNIGPAQVFGMELQSRRGEIVLGGEVKDVPTPLDTTMTRHHAFSDAAAMLTPGSSNAFGDTDLTISMVSGPVGGCTFSVKKYPVPPGGGSATTGELPVYWDISTDCTDPYNLTLEFDYTDVELWNGVSIVETELEAYKSSDSGLTWICQSCELIDPVDEANNRFTVTGVTSVSEWGLSSEAPTAVTMGTFFSQPQLYSIELVWDTVVEVDLLYFNLYRSQDPLLLGVPINTETIEPRSNSGVGGAVYHFSDTTAQFGETYYYTLEAVSTDGIQRFGPVAGITWDHFIYLPQLQQ